MPVEFLGFTSRADFFPRIDVLVVPSLHDEALSRVVAEAYAHGVPVLGARRGGIPEIVDDGQTGFVFDPDEPAELAAAARRFVADPGLAHRMRAAIVARARELSPACIASEYREVYESLTRPRSSTTDSRGEEPDRSPVGTGR